MAAIYQEIELTWKGETYTVTPTYGLIQRIEQKYSIAGISARIANGEPPISHIAAIISTLLTAAGARDATPEEVYQVIMTDMDQDLFGDFCATVISGFIPQRPMRGNGGAPAKGAKSGKKTRT